MAARQITSLQANAPLARVRVASTTGRTLRLHEKGSAAADYFGNPAIGWPISSKL